MCHQACLLLFLFKQTSFPKVLSLPAVSKQEVFTTVFTSVSLRGSFTFHFLFLKALAKQLLKDI